MSSHMLSAIIVPVMSLSAAAAMTLADLADPTAAPVILGEGYGFCEGPAADGAGNVYFSDGRHDRIYLWRPGRGVELFLDDSTDANGMMFNSRGELVVCEGAAYRIVAINVHTKARRVLVGGKAEREYNEPNDLTIDRQDGFYFTDPNYRHRKQETIRKEDVYYVAPDGRVTTVSTVCKKPNGILLTPDNKVLYVADNADRCIYRYDVLGPGRLTNECRWAELPGGPDGLTLDEHGNLYVACGGAGIHVLAPDGRAIGTLLAGTYASNVVFGGPAFRMLLITSRDKFLGLPMKVRGIRPLAPPP